MYNLRHPNASEPDDLRYTKATEDGDHNGINYNRLFLQEGCDAMEKPNVRG